jgi:hypothetical protein
VDFVAASLPPYRALEVDGAQAVAALSHLKRVGPSARDKQQRRKVQDLTALFLNALEAQVRTRAQSPAPPRPIGFVRTPKAPPRPRRPLERHARCPARGAVLSLSSAARAGAGTLPISPPSPPPLVLCGHAASLTPY